jgi:hypothetical protein
MSVRFFFILLLLLPLAYAGSNESGYYSQQITSAYDTMAKMQDNGFSVIRYNDSLTEIRQLFANQEVFEDFNNSDYTLVSRKLESLKLIESNAYLNIDELNALKQYISSINDVDLSPVNEIYSEAEKSFKAERYEESLEKIEEAYEKISELEATSTKIKAMYEVTSRTITSFLKQNWRIISISTGVFMFLFLVFYMPVVNLFIRRHISSLEVRSHAIKSLIAKTQKEYFDHGTLSETTYHVRMKKYGELLRDINRQIPLLKQELAMNRGLLIKAFSFSKTKKGELQ